ncbi:protein MAIN-LIKE 2-like [Lotus japonicus]|uniref:protein MAIN-LIKE 2-like n=1 Tax=Lotus japonicus TaxID=34305 RepID=UPI0025903126|nr:protein MAIN-LIKE 2-like [Lotus japonicus]
MTNRKRSRAIEDVGATEDRHRRLHASSRRGDHAASSQAVEASAPVDSMQSPTVQAPVAVEATRGESSAPAMDPVVDPTDPVPTPPSPTVELSRHDSSGAESSGEDSSGKSSSEESSDEDSIPPSDVDADVVPEEGAQGGGAQGGVQDLIQRLPPFPGGPVELSLLTHYADHKAPWTWHSLLRTHERYQDRHHLKVATAGGKVWNLAFDGDSEGHRRVRELVEQTGLHQLPYCGYPETDAYHRYEDAARIWLVHQLGGTLFASKSGGYHTTVYWIGMLADLGRVPEYAWGAIALATLYDQLGRASRRETAQMGGFSSLLLGWAYEYLSDRVIIRRADPEHSQDQPRARRWVTSRVGRSGLDERRVMLDELTVGDIIWTPFEDHRAHRPRDPRAMYSGYIRMPFGRAVRPHLPERVLRQFGFIQDVPRHPSEVPTTGSLAETADAAYADFEPHMRPQGIPVSYAGEAVQDYMRWYGGVSHRFIIPDERREEFSAVTVVRRAVDLLEQSLEVPDTLAEGTHARSLTERALDLIRSSAFIGTQGVAFAAVRGLVGGRGRGGRVRGRGRAARGRGEGAPGEGARGARGRRGAVGVGWID